MSRHFDVVVLGAGPGGYVAAIRASQLGKQVAVVEDKYWGGVCLNVGCIPSKALLRNAELAHILEHEKDKFGITGDASMDFKPTHARSRKVSEGIVKGVHFLMKKNKIQEIDGWGTLTGEKSMDVALKDGGTEQLTYDQLIIATGATTRLIPGTELSERVVTYEEQILDEQLPGSIVIAGSGAIGVEFAYVMKNFGVDVTIVEFLDRMVPTEDAEISKELLKHYKKLGVKVLLSTKVESIDDSGDQVKVTVSKDGKEEVIETDKVLQAIGFAPRVEGFGLDAAGVKLTDRGAIEIDEFGRTNVDGVYAIGDCTGKLMLAHTAEAHGRGRRRDDRRGRHDAGGVRLHPAGDVLPAAGGLLRLLRGAGQGEGVRRQDREVPVLGQRQGHGARRQRRLREGGGRRAVQRDHRRPPDRPGRHRAAAGADARAALGPHRRRGRPQRVRPPDAVRGRQGGRRGHRRPHDQPLTYPQLPLTRHLLGGLAACRRSW